MQTVGFIGCGKMGGALLAGWLDAGVVDAARVTVADPYTGEALAAEHGVTVGDAVAAARADVVVLAVKPHQVGDALAAAKLRGEQLVISVCAGVPRATIAAAVAPARAVRVMPNLGVRLGVGVTLVLGDGETAAADAERVAALFGAVGHAEVLGDEALFHAGTALVGSGPAYLFVAMQAMADGAVAGGLPREAARRLAAATVRAAGALAGEDGAHPEALKDAVASPGGTTIAALGILERRGFRGALFDAVEAASARSRALADEGGRSR
ncbi:MAG: pyrroline-5-carboxylate reductase [bacterium]